MMYETTILLSFEAGKGVLCEEVVAFLGVHVSPGRQCLSHHHHQQIIWVVATCTGWKAPHSLVAGLICIGSTWVEVHLYRLKGSQINMWTQTQTWYQCKVSLYGWAFVDDKTKEKEVGEVDHLNQKYLKVSNTSSHISLYIKNNSCFPKNVFCGSLDALV